MGLTGAQPEEVLQMGGAFGQLGGYVCGKGYMHPEA
jgi:hypothetical protein